MYFRSSNRRRKLRPNRCIIGDAILPQTGKKWPKMQSGIWRLAVAPSNAASKNCNIYAQLQSLRCITAPKLFWKIYHLYDFWCAQTCSFWAVFGLPVRSLTIAVSDFLCGVSWRYSRATNSEPHFYRQVVMATWWLVLNLLSASVTKNPFFFRPWRTNYALDRKMVNTF